MRSNPRYPRTVSRTPDGSKDIRVFVWIRDLRGYLCWVENGESLTAFLEPEAQGPVQERLTNARRLGEAAMAFVEAVEEIVR